MRNELKALIVQLRAAVWLTVMMLVMLVVTVWLQMQHQGKDDEFEKKIKELTTPVKVEDVLRVFEEQRRGENE